MKKPGRSLKIKEKSLWLGRASSCVVLESTRRTPPWASLIPRCSRPRSSPACTDRRGTSEANLRDHLAPGFRIYVIKYLPWEVG